MNNNEYDKHCEKILSTILENLQYYKDIHDKILPEYFFSNKQKIIVKSIQDVFNDNGYVTLDLIYSNIDILEKSVEEYISSIRSNQFPFKHIITHLDRLLEIYKLSEFKNIAYKDIFNLLNSEEHFSIDDELTNVISKLENLKMSDNSPKLIRSMAQITVDTIKEIEDACNGDDIQFMPTGIPSIDSEIGGLFPKETSLIFADSSMGKSGLSLKIGFNIAKSGKNVLYFTPEMSDTRTIKRVLSSQTKISAEKIRLGDLSQEEIKILSNKAKELSNIPFFINDKSKIDISEIVRLSKLQDFILRKDGSDGVDLIIVDYIQILKALGRKESTSIDHISEVCCELQNLAKDLDAHIMMLSQISQKARQEQRRPIAGDVIGASHIVNTVDLALSCYREHRYHCSQENNAKSDQNLYTKWKLKEAAIRNIAEVTCHKNRDGKLFNSILHFDHETVSFS